MNQVGFFSDDGREYIISVPRAPRHWFNYLWNQDYVGLISQVGQGESLLQDACGHRVALIAARMLFIRDAETHHFWTANALPPDRATDYRCIHSRDGVTTIHLTQNQLSSRFRVFVPTDFPGEVWTLQITNESKHPRQVQIFPFVDTLIDGPDKPQAYYMSVGWWDDERRTLWVQAECKMTKTRHCAIFIAASDPVIGFDAEQRAFIGYGAIQRPDALLQEGCRNTCCEMSKPILALEHAVILSAGETREMHWLIGGMPLEADAFDRIEAWRARFLKRESGVAQALMATQTTIERELGEITFSTSDADFNHFATCWLPRQISLGAQWARVRHNGFRDQMQDIAAMATFNPRQALQHFLRVIRFQYADGRAPRTWLHGKILDKNFSDNHVWIPLTLHRLVMETGDLAILAQEAPFNDGSRATLFEHARRAVDNLWADRGLFGLCRIRGGDWNDGLDKVGVQGRGVSVWLSMALHLANEQTATLAELRHDSALAQELRRRNRVLREAINRYGWDGEYYLRAFDDDGRPIGSQKCDAGRVYLNPQSWAVIANVADDERARQALIAAEALLQSDVGLRIMAPGYRAWNPKLGLISRKTPGIQENGGVYLHALAFKLVADAMLGRRASVAEDIANMLPFQRVTDGEPYVFSNGYYAVECKHRRGQSGQSWGTGAASWFYIALLDHVFGLRPEPPGLRIKPCLPAGWQEASIVRPFRGAFYHIRYHQNTTADGALQVDVSVNGKRWTKPHLPHRSGQRFEVRVALRQ
ncbi:MAG: hypothetical protein GXP42_05060 [Chloroflexi bacterium]|nr:hypothetical protein [Chloroflexota bacterium]